MDAIASSEVTHFATLKPIPGPVGRFVAHADGGLLPLERPGRAPECPMYRPYGLVQAWTLTTGADRSPGYRYSIIEDPVQLIDIDTEKDFHRAETALKGGLCDFLRH